MDEKEFTELTPFQKAVIERLDFIEKKLKKSNLKCGKSNRISHVSTQI